MVGTRLEVPDCIDSLFRNWHGNMDTATMYYVLFISLVGYCSACVPLDFGYDGIVCVCNGTYCDLPEKLPALENDEFVTYTSSASGTRLKFAKLRVNQGFEHTPLQRTYLDFLKIIYFCR